jgi:hypothetical protein
MNGLISERPICPNAVETIGYVAAECDKHHNAPAQTQIPPSGGTAPLIVATGIVAWVVAAVRFFVHAFGIILRAVRVRGHGNRHECRRGLAHIKYGQIFNGNCILRHRFTLPVLPVGYVAE